MIINSGGSGGGVKVVKLANVTNFSNGSVTLNQAYTDFDFIYFQADFHWLSTGSYEYVNAILLVKAIQKTWKYLVLRTLSGKAEGYEAATVVGFDPDKPTVINIEYTLRSYGYKTLEIYGIKIGG